MSDRRAELIAAAVQGRLTDAERAELRELAAADPGVDVEISELRSTAEAIALLQNWETVNPDESLRNRVIAAVREDHNDVAPRSRSRWWAAAGVAAGVVIGVAGAVSVDSVRSTPPSGPPGTLGAVEHIEFIGEPDGVTLVGDLVAHTWGTETILEIDGLPAGQRYAVVLVGRDGDVYESGTFLGSEVTIDCRMNAAVLRPDVADVEIRDGAGAVIGVAHAPVVS